MYKSPIKAETLRKLWTLIPQKMRIGSLGQIFLMVLSAGLELIGIGLIVPIITVITGSSSQSNNSILQPVFNHFGVVDEQSMVVLALGFLGLAFLLKSIFAAYMG